MTAAEKQAPDRNLAMELVRVTEAAALAASRWMGRGDKEGADGAAVAKALGRDVRDLTAVILDRDRHADLIAEVRAAGARTRLIPDGDVLGAIATAWPDLDVDILFGVGGTPEGV